MPASRPSAVGLRTEASPMFKDQVKSKRVPRSPGSARVKCLAWWCDKKFGRTADMRKHMDAKHLGYYWQCAYPACPEACAQKANLETHVKNVHTRELSSVCSCGQGFTDPSLLSRHRKVTGHERNPKAKRNSSGASIRCRLEEASDVTVELISDPSYIPKLFDLTFDCSNPSTGQTASPSSQSSSSNPSYPSSSRSCTPPPYPSSAHPTSLNLGAVIPTSPSCFTLNPEQHVLDGSSSEWPNLLHGVTWSSLQLPLAAPPNELLPVSDDYGWNHPQTALPEEVFPPMDYPQTQEYPSQPENPADLGPILRELGLLDPQIGSQTPFHTAAPNAGVNYLGWGEFPAFPPALLPSQSQQCHFAHNLDLIY